MDSIMNRSCAGVVVVACLCQPAFADPESLENAKQALRQIERTGRSVSFSEFVDLVNRDDILLTEREYLELRRNVGTAHAPEISRDELAQLILAKREMIVDYVFQVSTEEAGTGAFPSCRVQLAGSGDRYFSRQCRFDTEGQETMHRMTSFDGEFIRQYDGIANRGFMASLNDRYRHDLVLPWCNPIGYSMLMDTEARLGTEFSGCDLVALIENDFATLFAGRQEVDGHSCLVVDDHATTAYLAPELDFCVVRREDWNYQDDDDVSLSRFERFASFADFREVADSLTFPMRATLHDSSSGQQTVITVDKMVINGGVEDAVFQNRPDETRTFEILDDGEQVERD